MTITIGSGLMNSVFGNSQYPIQNFLEKRGESWEQKSMIKELFNISSSNHWAEKFTTMTAMEGFVPVGENGLYPSDAMQEGFSKVFEHMTWKNSFSLSRELVDDSKAMDLRNKPEAFISSYYRTRERFAAALFGGAMNCDDTVTFGGQSFDVTTADGEALFSGEHMSILNSSDTQSNLFADDVSIEALGAMECAMQEFRGDNGEILDVIPDTILIPNDYKLKEAVFNAIGIEKEVKAEMNSFNYQFGRWNVIVWPYLNKYIEEGSKPWVMLASEYNKLYAGATWIDRVKLEVKSDIDKDTDANIWRGYSRFTAGFNDWRFAAIGGIEDGDTLVS